MCLIGVLENFCFLVIAAVDVELKVYRVQFRNAGIKKKHLFAFMTFCRPHNH